MSAKTALAGALALGLATGLCGLRWGLPGSARLAAFPERLKPTAEVADRLTRSWEQLYQGIVATHRDLRPEEPVTYVQGVDVIGPGWDWPPPKLANSYRSLLLRSENPDEQKPFVVLSRMRPWRLELEPLYIHYGGAFIYPLGAFLAAAAVVRAVTLVGDMRHYLMHPDDMRGLYVAGRLFLLAFSLGSLAVLFELGRRLGGVAAGFWAAVFYALCPMVIVNAHDLKPHPYSAFWCLAAVLLASLAVDSGRRRDYLWCGVCAGMAAGSNFSFLVFAALPAAAWLWRRARKTELVSAALGCAAAAGLWLATNPYVILAARDYVWETTVYPTARKAGAAAALRGLLPLLGSQLTVELGLVVQLLAAAGLIRALSRGRDRRRFVAAVLVGAGAILWAGLAFLWGFMSGPEAVRFFYPLVGLACVLAADFAVSGPLPRWAKVLAVAAALADGGVRSGVYLANLHLDDTPRGTRQRAAAWIEGHVPPGGSIGLSRYPQPTSTPAFRYDRYKLVVFERLDLVAPARYPDFIVVDGPGRGAVEQAPAAGAFELVESFKPVELAWGRVYDGSFFANAAMYVYKRRGAA